MSKRCYYDVLGCNKGAPVAELKSAYRKLAMELHPDRNPGDHTSEAKFKEINEAYDVLKDEQKRAAYDRFGHAAFEQGHGGGGIVATTDRRDDFAGTQWAQCRPRCIERAGLTGNGQRDCRENARAGRKRD